MKCFSGSITKNEYDASVLMDVLVLKRTELQHNLLIRVSFIILSGEKVYFNYFPRLHAVQVSLPSTDTCVWQRR